MNMLKDIKKSYKKLAILGMGSSGEVYLYEKIQQKVEETTNNESKQILKKDVQFKPKLRNNKYFALKKLKRIDQVEDIYTVPQVKIMNKLKHQNLMTFSEIVQNDKGYEVNKYLVMEYGIEIMDIVKCKQLKIKSKHIKQIVRQIVQGLHELHKSQILHRDVKPQNIYAFPSGQVRLGDFSISRQMNNSKSENESLTGNVVTRCFRPPEIMFGSKNYSYSVDIWSLGCTIAQLVIQKHLFPGQTDLQQLQLIFQMLGAPGKDWPEVKQLPYYLQFTLQGSPKGLESVFPKEDENLFELIKWMLTMNPGKRPTTQEILKHKYFDDYDQNLRELGKMASYLSERRLNKYT